MRNEYAKSRLFSRRVLLLSGLKAAIFTTLAGRLYYLQLVKTNEYKTLSDGNRIRLMPIIPSRGKILDRFGIPMATDHSHFQLLFDVAEKRKAEDVVGRIARIIALDDTKVQQVLKKIQAARVGDIVTVEDYLSWEKVSMIEVNRPDLPGISVNMAEERYYPYGDLSSHVIGYIGPPAHDEMKEHPLRKNPDFRIGKNGIEKAAEDWLHGRPGIRRLEVNAHGVAVSELSIDKSVPGNDLPVTLDADLQKFTSQRLMGQGGVETEGAAAVVIDIRTGGIMAMASRPGFDPNLFTKGIRNEDWRRLNDDLDKPLLNKSITSQYPPGSTFKMVVALAALESGIAKPETTVFCPGYFMFGSRPFKCWKQGGHGTVNLKTAIQASCNVYFYTMAQRMGIDKIADMAKKFGLGERYGLGLPSEKPGVVPSPDWKRRMFKQDWLAAETINTGIGQGYTLTTPLQLAVMTARLATGKKILPTLFSDPRMAGLQDVSAYEDIAVSPQNLKLVQEGMRMVVNEPGGTALRHRLLPEDFVMAGKTGTSQVRGNKPGQEKSDLRKFKNHGLFVAYVPYENPLFAVAVVVEHGGSGSGAAAPIAKDIFNELYRLMQQKDYGYKVKGYPTEPPSASKPPSAEAATTDETGASASEAPVEEEPEVMPDE